MQGKETQAKNLLETTLFTILRQFQNQVLFEQKVNFIYILRRVDSVILETTDFII